MIESEIQNAIFHELGRVPDCTLWRNNVGTSRAEVVTPEHLQRLLSMLASKNDTNGAISLIKALLDERPRFTRFGLCEGSSDIVGIVESRHARVVEGDACRARFGTFLALEVKRPGKKPTVVQQLFLDLVNRRGGIGRCVHSVDEARAAINEARAL